MNLREWLIVLGGVIIVGIVVDGIRRMRRARRDSLEISLGMGGEIENSPLDEGFNPELPNGGARLAGDAPSIIGNPVGTDLNSANSSQLDEEISLVSPSFEESTSRIEPSIDVGGNDNRFDEDDLSPARVVSRETRTPTFSEATISDRTELDSTELDSTELDSTDTVSDTNKNCSDAIRATKSSHTDKPLRPTESVAAPKKKQKPKMTFGEGLKASNAKPQSGKAKSKRSEPDSQPKPAQEVIILNVLSKSGEVFKGADLKALLEACGVEHGDMSIFHRHENTMDSPVQFSVANAVEPGYFPSDQLDVMTTPGISFFMSLPGPDDNMRAFDYMLETAQCVVRNLSGELKDERRSDMTPQTLEHCRQRIRDFERRQLTAKC